MSNRPLELKSQHLWSLVEDVTKPRPVEHDEDGNPTGDMNVPDWVVRAMLEDLKALTAHVATLQAQRGFEPVPDGAYVSNGNSIRIFQKMLGIAPEEAARVYAGKLPDGWIIMRPMEEPTYE